MTTITKEKIESTLPTLRASFSVVLFLLRVTTYFVLAIVLFSFFSGKAVAVIAYSLTAIFTVAGGYAIDGLLDKLLPLAATRGRAENRDLAQFHWIARFLAAALLIVTGTLSWWAMPEVAEVAVREVDTTEEMETIKQLSADTRAALEQKSAELEKAELTERTRIARAEQEGRALIDAAVASGTDSQREMYARNPGFFYALNRKSRYYRTNKAYISRVDEAKKTAAELVQKEKGIAERIRTEKSLLESNRATKTDATIRGIASAVETRVQRREMRLDNLSNILLIMDLSWMIIAAVLAYLIGLVDGHDLTERKNAIGLIFEVATHAEQSALRTVEWNLIGRNADAKPTQTRRNGPTERAPYPDATPTVIPVRNVPDATPDATAFAKTVLSVIQENMTAPTQPTEPTEQRPRTEQRREDSDATPDAKPTVIVLDCPTEPTQRARRKTTKQERNATEKRLCLNCDTDISDRTKRAKYCCDACRKNYHEKLKN